MLKIGLTGGIACGKTYICQLFRAYGVTIIDADVISREVVEPNMPTLQKISDVFGAEILDEHGALKRKILRQIVFNSPDALDLLNSIVHPAVHNRIIEIAQLASQGKPLPETYLEISAQRLAASLPSDLNPEQIALFKQPLDPSKVIKPGSVPPYVILDIPLLFEKKLNDLVNHILVIDVPVELQVQRIMTRDNSTEENARKIIASQVSREQRLAQADDIIDTSISDLEEKRAIVLNLHNKFIELASLK